MDYLPISYINQYAYCPRRFWYMYVQGEMEINAHVLRGVQAHERAHTPGYETVTEGVRVHRRVYVYSHRYLLTGYCDLVEEHPDGVLVPVEYKQGRQGKWSNDRAQLCAQALCLEEMTGKEIQRGAIFYFGSRRRVQVTFDATLRSETVALIHAMRDTLTQGQIPPHTDQTGRCRGCSLVDVCLPKESNILHRSG